MVMTATGAVHMCLRLGVFVCMVMSMLMSMRVAVVMAVPMIMVTVTCVCSVFAVSTVFRFESFVNCHHGHVHIAQHIGQHVVGLNF